MNGFFKLPPLFSQKFEKGWATLINNREMLCLHKDPSNSLDLFQGVAQPYYTSKPKIYTSY